MLFSPRLAFAFASPPPALSEVSLLSTLTWHHKNHYQPSQNPSLDPVEPLPQQTQLKEEAEEEKEEENNNERDDCWFISILMAPTWWARKI